MQRHAAPGLSRNLSSEPLDKPMAAVPVLEYFRLCHEEAGVDPGRKDRQRDAVPLRSQELERLPDVLRRFRSPTNW